MREVVNGLMYILSTGYHWAKSLKVPTANPVE